MDLLRKQKVVSSAYDIEKIDSVEFVRSLIHKRNRIELKVDPCGKFESLVED